MARKCIAFSLHAVPTQCSQTYKNVDYTPVFQQTLKQAACLFHFHQQCKTAAYTLKECLHTSRDVLLHSEAKSQLPIQNPDFSFNPDRRRAVCLICSHLHVDLRRCTQSSQTSYPLCHNNRSPPASALCVICPGPHCSLLCSLPAVLWEGRPKPTRVFSWHLYFGVPPSSRTRS